MKKIGIILILMFGIYAYAQTPYDSFAPEVSHINDNIRKWLSVDPLADKYPNISPYAYCSWNPVKFVDPDGRIVQVFDADGVSTLYNTLNTSDRAHVSIDEQGYVAIDQEHVFYTGSNNYKALAELVESNTTYTIATGNSFEYKNEKGSTMLGYMSPVQVIPDFGQDAFGFDTNETGWLGVTQTPGEEPNKYNSLDNSVHVLINSTLSTEGKAQILSHELYGHALLYQRGQPHTHKERNGIEQNSILREAITIAISETKQNMRGR